MKINKEITIKYVESLSQRLEDNNNNMDLVIPINGIKNKNFSSLPSFLQFFSTWFRSSKRGNLSFDTNIEKLKEYEDSDIYTFLTSSLAWQQLDIRDINGIDVKNEIRKSNISFHEKQRNFLGSKGTEILLACFDFDRTLDNRGLLRLLYDNNGKLKDEPYFKHNLVPEIANSIGKRFSTGLLKNSFNKSDYNSLGEILYELFKNTHEWGREKEDRITPLIPNLRSIYVLQHRSNKKNFLEFAEGNKGLQSYLSSEKFTSNSNNDIFFLEVSVFDSGIGFVRQSLGESYVHNSVPIKEQVDIVKKCLTKYFTTDSGQLSQHKGKGLDKVLHALDGKGFLRIRTENVSLYRDLIKDDYSKISNSSDIDLYDWATESNSIYTKFPTVEGATISLIYPIIATHE